MNLQVFSPLLVAFFSTGSAFRQAEIYHRRCAAKTRDPLQGANGFCAHPPRQQKIPHTGLNSKYKSPDEGNSYNDDAFGLLFLTGGVLSQDVDFVGTFASLSAMAAVGTKLGFVRKDERAPAAVAMSTLLISPFVASLRTSGSLDSVAYPMPAEVGLCVLSSIWAFANWSRRE
ncbi:hypothetical protein ACHAWF_013851 [Thalassiosira exigua]